MPRRVLVVSDENPAEGGIAVGLDGCKQVTWRDFSPQLLGARRTDLLIAVATAERLRLAQLQEWRTGDQRWRLLAVLPAESPKEDLQFALSIADDLVLSSERQDIFELRVRRLLDSCGTDADAAGSGRGLRSEGDREGAACSWDDRGAVARKR